MAVAKKTRQQARVAASPQSARTGVLLGAAAVAVAVLTYARAFSYGFIWDDPIVLEQLRSFHSLRDLIVLPEAVPKFYYRPLTFATLLLDRALGGEDPFWFHATVIFWHAVVTGLVFWLGRALLGSLRDVEAGLAALLFAVHPIHVESVAWIAGRSDVIAAAFVIGVVLVGSRTRQPWTAWAAGGLLLLGLLAKEVVIASLLLVPARDLFAERRLRVARYAPLVLAAVIYFSLRYNFLNAVTGGLPPPSSPAEQLRDVFAAFGWYVTTLVLPANLNAYVSKVPASPLFLAAGLAAIAGLVAGTLLAWSRGTWVVGFLLFWFGATLAPSLLVILRRSASALVADRYLYLPSVAAVLLVGWLVARLRDVSPRIWKSSMSAVAVACAVFAAMSVSRGRVWADELVFWSDVAAKSPDDALPHRELGSVFMRREQLDAAENSFLTALSARSDREGTVMTCGNLGNLYLRQSRLDEAEKVFRKGIELYPHPHLYNGIGRVAMKRAEEAQKRGDQAQVVREVYAARDALQQAIVLDASDYKSHVLLGQVLLSLGKRAEAREHLEAALRIEPQGGIADIARQYLKQLAS